MSIMLIVDAMRRAATAQEVCFLMTSYVETLVFYDTARHLPAGVIALPVRGLVDTAARLACLLDLQERERTHLPCSADFCIIEEATELFREALFRLNALEADDVKSFSFERRATARPGVSLSH
jgi:hypothetical protein